MSQFFGGSGGGGTRTDRKAQLSSWGDLQQLFNTGLSLGRYQSYQGAGGLGKSLNYFQQLMKGGPAAQSVLAPAISAIQGQSAQQRATTAQFGNRAGGTNAAQQANEEAARTSIQQLIEQLGPEAAQAVAQISSLISQFGGEQERIAGTSAAEVGSQASDDIGQQREIGAGIGQDMGTLASTLAFGV